MKIASMIVSLKGCNLNQLWFSYNPLLLLLVESLFYFNLFSCFILSVDSNINEGHVSIPCLASNLVFSYLFEKYATYSKNIFFLNSFSDPGWCTPTFNIWSCSEWGAAMYSAGQNHVYIIAFFVYFCFEIWSFCWTLRIYM